MAGSYDTKCWELADAFLIDEPHLRDVDRIDRLASTIQEAVEDWIKSENDNYEGPDPMRGVEFRKGFVMTALSDAMVSLQPSWRCERCRGNGEIVTDWDRYLHPGPDDQGDAAVVECPDCDGTGKPATPPEPSALDRAVELDLRSANAARQAEWDQDNRITLEYRGNELAGEVGEACNIIKKLARERLGIKGSRATIEQLAEELADVVICADLIAMDAGIDLLGEAVPDKFNATSEKVGLATRLAIRGNGGGR